jgi:hypothetical protein
MSSATYYEDAYEQLYNYKARINASNTPVVDLKGTASVYSKFISMFSTEVHDPLYCFKP